MTFREFFRSWFPSRHSRETSDSTNPGAAKVAFATKSKVASHVPNDQLADIANIAVKSFELSGVDDEKACKATLEDIKGEDDIIIAVMGATGVGKTTFISAIAGKVVQGVGHNLDAGTIEVGCFRLPIPGTNSHLVLVDTPGFDDPQRTNAEILTTIAEWLKKSYKEDKKLNGIIYLHRVTDIRFDSGASTTLTLFKHLCGGEVFNKVCLVSTKWNDVHPDHKSEYEVKEASLKKDHWGVLIAKGSITSRFDSTTDASAKETAMSTLRDIVGHINEKFVTQIQRELVDKGKKIYKTAAGKYAFTTEEKISAQLTQLSGILVTT
ncbi:P-loop containing nucleoside triphosphate hydrolase protein [Panaeolus papilionaceus]|nr:P-loop containing nucleoside triphosphate hydrolase protein [Panaeolus papilionaceus]